MPPFLGVAEHIVPTTAKAEFISLKVSRKLIISGELAIILRLCKRC